MLRGGGFGLHAAIGRFFKTGFTTQCGLVAGLGMIAVSFASLIDNSLFLPGRDVGLLQHPAIWAFLTLQFLLPIALRRSLTRLLMARSSLRKLGALQGDAHAQIVIPILRFMRLEDPLGRLSAVFVYLLGLVAFVWNTYQNQRPGIVLPYDFWDSSSFIFGFWTTRILKLYLFCWLLPYLAMLHFGILITGLRLIRRARCAGSLLLMPFHPDGAGGLGFLPNLVTKPLVVGVLIGILPTLAALQVHRKLDVTPTMGLGLLLLAITIGYLVPILSLRKDIVATKRMMIHRLRWLQQSTYASALESEQPDLTALRTASESIDNIDNLVNAINSVSNFPHLKRLVAMFALALSPTAISTMAALYERFEPTIRSILAQP